MKKYIWTHKKTKIKACTFKTCVSLCQLYFNNYSGWTHIRLNQALIGVYWSVATLHWSVCWFYSLLVECLILLLVTLIWAQLSASLLSLYASVLDIGWKIGGQKRLFRCLVQRWKVLWIVFIIFTFCCNQEIYNNMKEVHCFRVYYNFGTKYHLKILKSVHSFSI